MIGIPPAKPRKGNQALLKGPDTRFAVWKCLACTSDQRCNWQRNLLERGLMQHGQLMEVHLFERGVSSSGVGRIERKGQGVHAVRHQQASPLNAGVQRSEVGDAERVFQEARLLWEYLTDGDLSGACTIVCRLLENIRGVGLPSAVHSSVRAASVCPVL